MTFDEWAEENWMYIDVKENARVIWDAASSDQREACADLADEMEQHGWTGATIASAIRNAP